MPETMTLEDIIKAVSICSDEDSVCTPECPMHDMDLDLPLDVSCRGALLKMCLPVLESVRDNKNQRQDGKWLSYGEGRLYDVIRCSKCSHEAFRVKHKLCTEYILSNFCPSCGAHMIGEENKDAENA